MHTDHEVIEQKFMDAISGYYEFYPDEPSNEFLSTFTNSWNELANQIQYAKLNDDKDLPVVIVNAERKKISLLNTTSAFYDKLMKRIEYIVRTLERFITQNAVSFKSKLELAIVQFKKCIDGRCLGVYIFDANSILKGIHDCDFPDIVNEIGQQIRSLERLLKELALTFARYLGIRKSLNHLDFYGELHRYGDVELDVDGMNIFTYNYLTNCTLSELFKMGHDVNTAICIRFLSLNKMQNIPQYDAYCQIQDELELSGLRTDNFPNESKNLADRARRLHEKRLKELRSFND